MHKQSLSPFFNDGVNDAITGGKSLCTADERKCEKLICGSAVNTSTFIQLKIYAQIGL